MPRELGEAILNELRTIRLLLQKQQAALPALPPAAPETARVSTAGPALGRVDAPLTLVEFADYQCPFCRQFQSTVFEKLRTEFIETGKVRFISRDLPLDFHPNAMSAAKASLCAGEQGKYWEMRSELIEHADQLDAAAIAKYATDAGLNAAEFAACASGDKYISRIRSDIAEAGAVGITGTPTFVLGASGGDTVEGIKLVGAQPFEAFEKAIRNQLAKASN